jgi:hypothetical protein
MARNDHYISQTYLKHFIGSNGCLVPYYKQGHVIVGKPKRPKSLCYETEGDTNKYFANHRLLDQFLPAFENPWHDNIAKLERGHIDSKTKFELSGYIAFLRSCTPTAKRLGQQLIAGIIKPLAYKVMENNLEKDNVIAKKDKAILKNDIKDNKIELNIDRDFAHAQHMIALVGMFYQLYCSQWRVLVNKTDMPFITSDNPATLYFKDDNQQIGGTYVPIKPNMALLILPNFSINNPTYEDVKKYDNSKDISGIIKPQYVNELNIHTIRCAENIVIHQKYEKWLEELVLKHRNWRTETKVSHIPIENGMITISRQQPVKQTK